MALRAVVFRDGEHWVGQCLEHDIGAQASGLDELLVRLELAVRLELQTSLEMTGEPFGAIPPAPPEFEEMWSNA